jgi:acetyl esterase/lipase
MPIGYLVATFFAAVATKIALAPEPTRGPRATPTFVLESAANELPFLILYWLVLSTALAVVQGNVRSPIGWIGVGVALLSTAGLIVVVRRALDACPALHAALDDAFGARPDGGPRASGRRSHTPWASVLIAPLRISGRGVEQTRNIAYGPAGRKNLLDLYRNRSRPSGGPAFVYLHPGGFFSGRKSREARSIIDQLVREGWVCVSANYRLRDAGAFPRNLIDAKLIVAWVRDHAEEHGADPGTIVVAGGSAGANLALTCALTANDQAFQPGFEDADTSVAAAIGLYGYYGAAPAPAGTRSAPGDYLRADAPPLLVIHGEHDPMVPAQDVRRFVERARAASSNPVVYAELPGGQHNFDRFPSIRSAAVADGIEAFVTEVRRTR